MGQSLRNPNPSLTISVLGIQQLMVHDHFVAAEGWLLAQHQRLPFPFLFSLARLTKQRFLGITSWAGHKEKREGKRETAFLLSHQSWTGHNIKTQRNSCPSNRLSDSRFAKRRLPVNSHSITLPHISSDSEEDCVASECWELSLCGHQAGHPSQRKRKELISPA